MRLPRVVQWAIPVLVGAVAFIATLLDIINALVTRQGDSVKGLPLLTLMISILITYYGIERYHHFRQLDDRLSELSAILSRNLSVRLLEGQEEIYLSPSRLWNRTEYRLRAVLAGNGPKAPEGYVKAVAGRLAQRHRDGYAVRFDAVLILDPDAISFAAVKRALDERVRLYADCGAGELVHLHIRSSACPVNFDMVIVDDQHVQIGFSY